MNPAPRTLYDKIWDDHSVMRRSDGQTLLYIDRHFLHEGSRRGFELLEERDLAPRRPDLITATADHYVPTDRSRTDSDEERDAVIAAFERNTAAHGIEAFGSSHPSQGIVHVIGPELGLTLPGMTIVCGDSHTSTHGALGALAFGIGASEVGHVLATQTLWQKRSKTMRILIEGSLAKGVSPKDVILAVIGRIGTGGATGHVIEYGGSVIRSLSIEGRLTVCNMSIEAGARAGLVAPDDLTLAYVEGRLHAPKGEAWRDAVARWRTLASDPDVVFDREISIDGGTLVPMVTWGTSPEEVMSIDGRVPDPAGMADPARKSSAVASLEYMGLRPGMSAGEIEFDHVFVGSCTNSRIEDIREVARIVRGRRVAGNIKAVVVPGSSAVKRQAEAEGLDAILRAAGFDWRDSGCSMCVGMNGDIIGPGQRSASTTNRNFVGRQGPLARTHLVSPATAAAVAVTGRLTDVRKLLP